VEFWISAHAPREATPNYSPVGIDDSETELKDVIDYFAIDNEIYK